MPPTTAPDILLSIATSGQQAVGYSLANGVIAIVEKLLRLVVYTAFMLYILAIYAK